MTCDHTSVSPDLSACARQSPIGQSWLQTWRTSLMMSNSKLALRTPRFSPLGANAAGHGFGLGLSQCHGDHSHEDPKLQLHTSFKSSPSDCNGSEGMGDEVQLQQHHHKVMPLGAPFRQPSPPENLPPQQATGRTTTGQSLRMDAPLSSQQLLQLQQQQQQQEEHSVIQAFCGSTAEFSSRSTNQVHADGHGCTADARAGHQLIATTNRSLMCREGKSRCWWPLSKPWWNLIARANHIHSSHLIRLHASSAEAAQRDLAAAVRQIDQLRQHLSTEIEGRSTTKTEFEQAMQFAAHQKSALDMALCFLQRQLHELGAANQSLTDEHECLKGKHAQLFTRHQELLASTQATEHELKHELREVEAQLGSVHQESDDTGLALQESQARLALSEQHVQQLAKRLTESEAGSVAATTPYMLESTFGVCDVECRGLSMSVVGGNLDQSVTTALPPVGFRDFCGPAHTLGGSKEAALVRGALLRFNHGSFEIGLGPQQIQQALDLLDWELQQLASAVANSMQQGGGSRTTDIDHKMLQCCSGVPADDEMEPCVDDVTIFGHRLDQPSCAGDPPVSSYERLLNIRSEMIISIFNDLIVSPLTAVCHPLSVLENAAHLSAKPETAVLASLMRSEACREMCAALNAALESSNTSLHGVLNTQTSQLQQVLTLRFKCPDLDVGKAVYQALLLGCLIPGAHPTLRPVCTVASASDVKLQLPFDSAVHEQVHDASGLDSSNPAARVLLRTLLPGVGFMGEAERIICERVVVTKHTFPHEGGRGC